MKISIKNWQYTPNSPDEGFGDNDCREIGRKFAEANKILNAALVIGSLSENDITTLSTQLNAVIDDVENQRYNLTADYSRSDYKHVMLNFINRLQYILNNRQSESLDDLLRPYELVDYQMPQYDGPPQTREKYKHLDLYLSHEQQLGNLVLNYPAIPVEIYRRNVKVQAALKLEAEKGPDITISIDKSLPQEKIQEAIPNTGLGFFSHNQLKSSDEKTNDQENKKGGEQYNVNG